MNVAIVGAGVAGLSAAVALHQKGHGVSVVESRDRVGGRLLSVGAARIDLGASWFWPNEHRVGRLTVESGTAVHTQYLDGDAVYHDGADSRRLDGNPIDAPSSRFTLGAASMTDALAAALPATCVRLNEPVRAINHAGDQLEVVTAAGSSLVDHVVLAVPPALVAHRVTFDPPLPERVATLAAATPVWMGAITKVVVGYAEPFWRRAGLAGAAISHRGPMREVHDLSGPGGDPAALFGFVPATSPDQATVDPDDAIQQLIEIFGPDAEAATDVHIQDWRDEIDTSPPGVEYLQDYQTFGHDLFGRPLFDGRLHWASTETAFEAPGHIEGALAAAERAVAAIVRAGSVDLEPADRSATDPEQRSTL